MFDVLLFWVSVSQRLLCCPVNFKGGLDMRVVLNHLCMVIITVFLGVA